MPVRRDAAGGSTLPGSYRGAPPVAGGQGSGAGPAGAITSPVTSGGWTPTASNLLLLVGLEIGLYCLLRWTFRRVHGG